MNGLISADKVCLWSVKDPDGLHLFERLWSSGCGHSLCFTHRGPKERGWKFCPWCEKLLLISAAPSIEQTLREAAKGETNER